MKKFLISVMFVSVASSSFAGGKFLSARQLSEYPDSNLSTYLVGLYDGISIAEFLEDSKNNMTVGTLLNTFRKLMNGYPQLGDLPASFVVSRILVENNVYKEKKTTIKK